MAHDNEKQLLKLLKMLDYKDNDIFLHLDKKNNSFNTDKIKQQVQIATIHIYSKYKVYWGDISQTKCQMFLLEESTKTFHDYYHLLSGHDLVLKTHEEIMSFFEKYAGKEFVHFESKEYCSKDTCTKYHFFRYAFNRTKSKWCRKYLTILDSFFIKLQNILGVNRKFYCGANWYSITHTLATQLLSEKKRLLRRLNFTISSDEYILQTYLMECGRQYNLYKSTEVNNYETVLRYIDWYRGGPYIWRKEDFKELVKSDYLYARKFDQNVDNEIIDMIVEFVEDKSNMYMMKGMELND